jgi:D-alanyl-lipoteichoic acid acyltransferase DltB (MBOAT superfamily)
MDQDNSDGQYANFRENVPYLALLLIAHPLLRRGYDALFLSNAYTAGPSKSRSKPGLTQGLTSLQAADGRLEQRISFDLLFGLIFIFALHGFSAFKVLGILYLNYKIGRDAPRAWVTPLTWIFNVGILFANEFGDGYSYAKVADVLTFGGIDGGLLVKLGAWMDSYGGLIPRWQVFFKVTILRLISFNTDWLWSRGSRSASPIEVCAAEIPNREEWRANDQKKKQLDPANLSERDRVSTPAKENDYTFRKYLAYALYAPLYLAGPILTFNDYIYQMRYKLPSITAQRTFMYAVRFGVVLLTMEVMIHYIYAVAIAKSNPDWTNYSPFQLSMLGYFHLHHIWLKLLILWRFFRLWALIDGIDPPENMVRCMSDNYSALGFWRSWHRSYNRWLVRYLYIPLGGGVSPGFTGRVRKIANFVLVFMFVAMWHDIDLRLLMWGWLITLFVLPEIIATIVFPAKKWKDRPDQYRVLCGIGAIGNILMMMAANLVGYAIGLDGLKGLLEGIFGSAGGVALFAAACGCLFIGVQLMFETREEEKRQGITMKC